MDLRWSEFKYKRRFQERQIRTIGDGKAADTARGTDEIQGAKEKVPLSSFTQSQVLSLPACAVERLHGPLHGARTEPD